MSMLYDREVICNFAPAGGEGLQANALRIEFDVSKTISGVPNEGMVRVWNLSTASRQKIGKELDQVTLEAGYRYASRGIILKGQVREVFHRRDGVDVITEVAVGDGDLQQRKGVIAKTYPRNTKIKDIVEDIYGHMPGVTRGELKGLDDLPPTRRPLTLIGPTSRQMDMLGRSHGFYWSIQNGSLETIPHDGYIDQIVVITPRTGMVDVPTVSDTGVVVTCLLNPEIRPNRLIEVRSDTTDMNDASGIYRVNGCSFYGDNKDGDFHVEVEGERVTGGKVTG